MRRKTYQVIEDVTSFIASKRCVQMQDIVKTGINLKLVKKIVDALLEEGMITRISEKTSKSYGLFAITDKGKELLCQK